MKYTIIAIAITLLSGILLGDVIMKKIHFHQDCGGYLERAANASTIETAEDELATAIYYMQKNQLTEGYTSVLWKTPEDDIGFWYNNLTSALVDLALMPDSASNMEKSNMLIKLREVLLDHDKNGDKLAVPPGISRYPNNGLYGTLLWIACLACIVSWTASSIELELA